MVANTNVEGGYVTIPLGRNTWKRTVAQAPSIFMVNRYYESTLTNLDGNQSMLLRPTLKRRTYVGDGPIRNMYYQDGVFNNDLFVVSGKAFYRVHKFDDNGFTPDTVTHITGTVNYVDPGDTPEIVAAYVTGGTPYIFVADGFSLQWTDGTSALATIVMPDDVSATGLAFIKGYVIVTVGAPFSQRFYWIQPGTTVVDPLDFAEAESSLDPVLNVRTVGDQFWLFGSQSTEPWYVTGDSTAPMAPLQGRPFSRGIWQGTPLKVNDSVITVGADGKVYDISAGPYPVSYPGIEERIRKAMLEQTYGDFS